VGGAALIIMHWVLFMFGFLAFLARLRLLCVFQRNLARSFPRTYDTSFKVIKRAGLVGDLDYHEQLGRLSHIRISLFFAKLIGLIIAQVRRQRSRKFVKTE